MTELSFTKMQGLGNDFVVLDGPVELSGAQIAALCDRRLGIGADGLLAVTPGQPVRMEYWNADGTPAEMCGNGLRCVARYAYDRGWADGESFEVETPVGVRRVSVGELIEVELGPTRVTGHTDYEGERLHLIDVGNPHAVMVVEDPEVVDVSEIGRRIGTDPQFPNGTNVEFSRVEDGEVSMRVWERGVGETLACGTGMVAAAFVATKTDKLSGPVSVTVPGGTGQVEFRDGVAWLRGPAEYSFTGTFEGR